jgi:hypothetical protein
MKIRVPEIIPIGGRQFKIVVMENLSCITNNDGTISYTLNQITLDKKCNKKEQTLTLVHEVVEGIDQCYLGGTMNHTQILQITEGVFQALNGLGIELDWEEFESRGA